MSPSQIETTARNHCERLNCALLELSRVRVACERRSDNWLSSELAAWHFLYHAPCYILPLFEKLRFDLEALLSAQPERVGDTDLATCAKVLVSTVTTVLSCTFLCSLNSFTKSIDPVRFSIGSHVASLMG